MNNSDKRRRARVQGGWAGPATNSNSAKNSAVSSSKSEGRNSRPNSAMSQTIANVRSDKDKPKRPVQPIWTGKNVDSPTPPQKFVFEDPSEDIKFKPSDKVITKGGVHDISTIPSGVSRIRFFPQFIDPRRTDAFFAELYHEIPWRQRHDIHNGVQAMQPRLTAWYSDQPYTYAGVTVEANTSEWPSVVTQLRDQLDEVTGIHFNALAINLYRDGHDSIGWHSDDEKIFGVNPSIASLSFGEERNFELRKNPEPDSNGERDYTYSQVIKVPLRSGDLLIMEGCTQTDWQHRVPKEYHDRGARINITFRLTMPA